MHNSKFLGRDRGIDMKSWKFLCSAPEDELQGWGIVTSASSPTTSFPQTKASFAFWRATSKLFRVQHDRVVTKHDTNFSMQLLVGSNWNRRDMTTKIAALKLEKLKWDTTQWNTTQEFLREGCNNDSVELHTRANMFNTRKVLKLKKWIDALWQFCHGKLSVMKIGLGTIPYPNKTPSISRPKVSSSQMYEKAPSKKILVQRKAR